MKLNEIIRHIEHIFPTEWALPNDPIGLHVGDPNQEIDTITVALEASSAVLDFSAANATNLLLVHHPLLYRPVKRLVESDPVQRIIRGLIRENIALYAGHTNVDLHPHGMAERWAHKLGCATAAPLLPKPQANLVKIVTFVPQTHTESVRSALARAGAGVIGEYDTCSFTSPGYGTFRGGDTTNPFIGKAGTLETADEERLEMVMHTHKKDAVIRALFSAHPYEEPAYDLYPQHDFRELSHAVWIGEFDEPCSWEALLETIRRSTPIPPEFVCVHPRQDKPIQKIALSTGSGSSMIPLVGGLGVDVYVTGEVGYHQMWEAEERGLNVITVGHGVSESFFPETVIPLLQPGAQGIEWISAVGV